ncbi:MAG: ABC transporter ATP-binding protein [Burkholderiales bacterium]
MASVNVNSLCVHFGGNEVISNLDLEVMEGEFLVLLGPSGCGKSTLLHSIAGLIEIAGGSIEIGGQDMTQAEPSERGIGMVFQSYALYPNMTVERNMSFGLRVAGTPKAEIERRVARTADMLQLQPLLERKPSQLSGGQRQRVAIGRALVRQADVFLFDEPLSNLDAKLRGELRRELKLLHKSLGSTMIYVTHDQVEAMTLASRIVIMRSGKIQQIGAPSEVYERPGNLFVAGFIGAPCMNFLHGVLRSDHIGYSLACSGVALDIESYGFLAPPVNEMGVILGIRPEDLRIHEGGALRAIVSLIEPMGAHYVVWLDFGGNPLSCIIAGALHFKVDAEVQFSIDVGRISLFDRESEQRL